MKAHRRLIHTSQQQYAAYTHAPTTDEEATATATPHLKPPNDEILENRIIRVTPVVAPNVCGPQRNTAHHHTLHDLDL
jgi:hypothetical protein